MKEDKILINSTLNGREEVEHCPFLLHEVNEGWFEKVLPVLKEPVCKIDREDCGYGLTETKVPDHCPLRDKVYFESITLKV